jgi:hypothetical protein
MKSGEEKRLKTRPKKKANQRRIHWRQDKEITLISHVLTRLKDLLDNAEGHQPKLKTQHQYYHQNQIKDEQLKNLESISFDLPKTNQM